MSGQGWRVMGISTTEGKTSPNPIRLFSQQTQPMTQLCKTKKEVDLYVDNLLKNCLTEKERSLRYFTAAKLYYSVQEFGTAKRFLESYIDKVQPTHSQLAEAYKFMGNILLEMNDKESALDYYKKCYEVLPTPHALNRVVDLLDSGFGVNETSESRKRWLGLQKTQIKGEISTPDGNTSMNSDSFRLYSSPIRGNSSFPNTSTPLFVPQNGNARAANTLVSPPKNEISEIQMQTIDNKFDKVMNKINEQGKKFDEGMSKVNDQLGKLMTQNVQLMQTFNSKLTSLDNEFKSLKKIVENTLENSNRCIGLKDDFEKMCKELTDRFEKQVDEIKNSSPKVQSAATAAPPPVVSIVANQQPAAPSSMKPMSELFKNPEGSWTCSGCYASNTKGHLKCLFCHAHKPGTEEVKSKSIEKKTVPPPSVSNFTFGSLSPPAPASTVTAHVSFSSDSTRESKPPASVVDKPKASPLKPTIGTVGSGFQFNFTSVAPGTLGFGDLAKDSSKTLGFGTPPSTTAKEPSKPFTGFGSPSTASSIFNAPVTPVFGGQTTSANPKPAKVTSPHDEDEADDFVPTAEFKPVIDLPPLVEVKKGDENENTIFEVRAKLYRLVEGEWKERGLGNIKILQDKENKSQVRIVMWREQIHKLACNHRITKDMEISYHSGSDKNLKWTANDFAEDEPKAEIFVCRFGKPEQCKEFKNHFEKLVDELKNSSPKIQSAVAAAPAVSIVANQQPAPALSSMKPLSELFKKPEGSWNCSECYASNTKDQLKCPCCQSLKPGTEEVKSNEEKTVPSSASNFIFGFPPASTTATPVISSSDSTHESKTQTSVVDTPKDSPLKPTSGTTGSGFQFSFTSVAPGTLGFGDLAKDSSKAFSGFGSPSTASSIFNAPVTPVFGGQTTTSVNPKPANLATAHDEDEADDFVPTAEFKPVIDLPPLVEVKKGDENENTLFEVRAKLYRLVEGEWKERGLGNIKILQDKQNKSQARIVMWREQIHKLACNHRITQDMEISYHSGSDKNLKWTANDFAEGEPKAEIFVCRFGKPEMCKEFKNHFEKLVDEMKNSSPKVPHSAVAVTAAPVASIVANQQPVLPTATKPLSELFKKPEGSWNCSECYASNTKDQLKCPCCQSLKPGTEAQAAVGDKAAPLSNFTFGFSPTSTASPTLTSHGDGDSSSCSGCIGCNPDTFKFDTLSKQKLPTYSEQNMTPEEYLEYIKRSGKEMESNSPVATSTPTKTESTPPSASALANFNFALPTSTSTPSKNLFSGINFGTPSFSFASQGAAASTPSPLFSTPLGSVALSSPEDVEDEEDENDYEDVEEEEEVEEVIHKGKATVSYRKQGEMNYTNLGNVPFEMIYDGNIYSYRFLIYGQNNDLILAHFICSDTHLVPLTSGEHSYAWSGLIDVLDGSYLRTEITAKFDNEEEYSTFFHKWSDGQDCAAQAYVNEVYILEGGEEEEEVEDEGEIEEEGE